MTGNGHKPNQLMRCQVCKACCDCVYVKTKGGQDLWRHWGTRHTWWRPVTICRNGRKAQDGRRVNNLVTERDSHIG
jgi:hypothetical protein